MTTRDQTTRRAIIAGAGAFAVFAAMPAAAKISTDAARQFVEATVAELEKISNSGSTGSRKAALRALLSRRAALPQIARSSLGVQWRSISKAQQAAFVDAFADYVAIKYAPRFKEFTGTRLEVTTAKDYGKRGVVVASVATLANGQKAMVDWGLSDRTGKTLLINIVIEGVSMVASERELIGAMLEARNGDLDLLIADMKAGKH